MKEPKRNILGEVFGTAIGFLDHSLNQDCECVSTNNGRM